MLYREQYIQEILHVGRCIPGPRTPGGGGGTPGGSGGGGMPGGSGGGGMPGGIGG